MQEINEDTTTLERHSSGSIRLLLMPIAISALLLAALLVS